LHLILGLPVTLFHRAGGSAWRPLARDLVAVLDSQWPGKVRFIGGDGRSIPGSMALPTSSP